MVDEKRIYTVPLRRGFNNTPKYKRAAKAVRVLKEFLAKHMKSDNVKLGKFLNEFLWKHGIKNPPARVKIHAQNVDGEVRAELEGKEYVVTKVVSKKEEPKSLKERIEAKLGDDKKKSPAKKAEAKKPEEKKVETKEKPVAKDKSEAKEKPIKETKSETLKETPKVEKTVEVKEKASNKVTKDEPKPEVKSKEDSKE